MPNNDRIQQALAFLAGVCDGYLSKEGAVIGMERLQEVTDHINALQELIRESAQHDSWRCAEYQECHCGLDEATDELGIPRIPYPPKIRA